MMVYVHENFVNLTLVQLNQVEIMKYLPLTITLVTLMCIGIAGNILVLYIYKLKFKQSSARVYILSLALADLTVCVFSIPYHILDLTLVLTYKHTPMCKAFSYFMGACTLSSIFILVVVGLDRYLKICRPMKKQIIDFGDRKACVIAVIMAMLLSIPNGIIYGHSSVNTGVNNITGIECFIDDKYHGSLLAFGYFGFIVLVFLILVILLISIYGFICHTIFKNRSTIITIKGERGLCLCCRKDSRDIDTDKNIENQKNFDMSSDDRGRHVRKEINCTKQRFIRTDQMIRHLWKPGIKTIENNTRKITLMMMTITFVFIVAYLPFIVISIVDVIDETFWEDLTHWKALLYDFLLRIYLINHAANPLIYSFWDDRFRKEIVRLFGNTFLCRKDCQEDGITNGRKVTCRSYSAKLTESFLTETP